MDNVKPVTKQSDEFPAQHHYPNGGYNLQNEGYNLPATRQGDSNPDQKPMSLQDIRDWLPATRDNDQAGSENKLPDHQKPMTLQDIREWRPAASGGEVPPIPISKPMTLEDIRSFRPVTRDNDHFPPQNKPEKSVPSYLQLPDIYGKGG